MGVNLRDVGIIVTYQVLSSSIRGLFEYMALLLMRRS